ncbi:hypothetical protein K7432_018230 [Basidiobolus ranarum]|uniref:Uncharacterized protein n=1 Tax=Basidiobolus ranarum TaxID=34480 RepID=A0ABR2WCF2_9FUNG
MPDPKYENHDDYDEAQDGDFEVVEAHDDDDQEDESVAQVEIEELKTLVKDPELHLESVGKDALLSMLKTLGHEDTMQSDQDVSTLALKVRDLVGSTEIYT